MKSVNAKVVSNLDDRGAQYNFMWVNVAIEAGAKEIFNIKSVPSFALVKGKKVLVHDETSVDEEILKK